jgi:hypothetical protein
MASAANDEEIETLATAGLDYPASVVFGVGEESKVMLQILHSFECRGWWKVPPTPV